MNRLWIAALVVVFSLAGFGLAYAIQTAEKAGDKKVLAVRESLEIRFAQTQVWPS